ncbi:hypothetical protein [Amycolatopsis silviterrae]|uniref:SMI1/KNR4 family protein n=1 Tax=Amycolatopsis silviterrae TaxID=1656914 RepID=A0ABW5HK35_9PSEU
MDYLEWREEVQGCIRRYRPRIEQIFSEGYVTDQVAETGADGDLLRRAALSEPPVPASLREFYAVVAEVDLGCVPNGLYVRPLGFVLDGINLPDQPGWIPEVTEERVIAFAGNGGGRAFCVGCDSGKVYRVPVGEIVDSVYQGSLDSVGPGVVENSVSDFMCHVLEIARANIADDFDDDLSLLR